MEKHWYRIVNGTRGFYAVENYKGEIVKDGLYYSEAIAYVKAHTEEVKSASEVVAFLEYLKENTDIVLAQPEGLLGSTLVPTPNDADSIARLLADFLTWKAHNN